MRILYVLNSLGVGGAERLVLALAARMQARGHQVALMVLLPPADADLSTELEHLHLGLTHNPSSWAGAIRRAGVFLGIFHPDLIHSHNFHGNLLARMLRILNRRPRLIATIHNIYEGQWPRMLAYALSDPLAHSTVAVSAAVAQRYVRWRAVPARKCVVLTNATDTRRFRPDDLRRPIARADLGMGSDFVWIAIGRDTRAKDLARLLEAFRTVRLQRNDVRLLIAGARSSNPRRKSRAGAAYGDGVTHLGPRADIPALLDASDAFVLSSAWEGMPLALAEAMAMEKPCVATDVGGVRELTGSTAILVGSGESLAAAMLRMMQMSPAVRAAMGATARQRICRFHSLEQKVDEWEKLYHSVLT